MSLVILEGERNLNVGRSSNRMRIRGRGSATKTFDQKKGVTVGGGVSLTNKADVGGSFKTKGQASATNEGTVGDVTTKDNSSFNNASQGTVSGNVTSKNTSSVSNSGTIEQNVTTKDQSSFNNASQGTVSGDVTSKDNSNVSNAGTIEGNVRAQDQSTFTNRSGGVVKQNVTLQDRSRGRFRNHSTVEGNVRAQDNSVARFQRKARVDGAVTGDSPSNLDLPPGGFADGANNGVGGSIRTGAQSLPGEDSGAAPKGNRRRPRSGGLGSGGRAGVALGGGASRRRLLG